MPLISWNIYDKTVTKKYSYWLVPNKTQQILLAKNLVCLHVVYNHIL
ncbi:helix-turn-helix domain-containing protein [Galbibacter sp.]